MEFISEFRPPLFMQSTSTVLVSGYNSPQFRKLQCEGDKDVFLKHDQHLEVVLLFPERSRVNEGHPGCSLFSQAENVKPCNTWRLLHERCV